MEKVIMRLRKSHGLYNKGEIAGFDGTTATNLEAHGIAERYKPEADGVPAEPAGQGTGKTGGTPTDQSGSGESTAKKNDGAGKSDGGATTSKASPALPSQGTKG